MPCEIAEHTPEDKALADELAKYAKYRLEHLCLFHKLFVDTHERKRCRWKNVEKCMWHEAHEQMQEWYDKREKIAKYK